MWGVEFLCLSQVPPCVSTSESGMNTCRLTLSNDFVSTRDVLDVANNLYTNVSPQNWYHCIRHPLCLQASQSPSALLWPPLLAVCITWKKNSQYCGVYVSMRYPAYKFCILLSVIIWGFFWFQKCLDLAQDNAVCQTMLGVCYMSQGAFYKAVKAHTKVCPCVCGGGGGQRVLYACRCQSLPHTLLSEFIYHFLAFYYWSHLLIG